MTDFGSDAVARLSAIKIELRTIRVTVCRGVWLAWRTKARCSGAAEHFARDSIEDRTGKEKDRVAITDPKTVRSKKSIGAVTTLQMEDEARLKP